MAKRKRHALPHFHYYVPVGLRSFRCVLAFRGALTSASLQSRRPLSLPLRTLPYAPPPLASNRQPPSDQQVNIKTPKSRAIHFSIYTSTSKSPILPNDPPTIPALHSNCRKCACFSCQVYQSFSTTGGWLQSVTSIPFRATACFLFL